MKTSTKKLIVTLSVSLLLLSSYFGLINIQKASATITKTVLFSDDFESGSFNGALWGGSGEVQSDIVKTGSYACNISVNNIHNAAPVAISPDSYISFWWRTDTIPNDIDNNAEILEIVYSDDGGYLKLLDNSTTGNIVYAGGNSYFPLTITANAWYNVTIHFQKDESTGSTNSTVWINSALRDSATGINTVAEPDDTIRFFTMPSTGTITIDDVQVYTLSGIPAPTPNSVSHNLVSPDIGATATSWLQNFIYTPVLYGSDKFVDASLYVNNSLVANNATRILNDTSNAISYLFSQNGFYVWDIEVSNSTASVFSVNGNFTLNVNQASPAPPTDWFETNFNNQKTGYNPITVDNSYTIKWTYPLTFFIRSSPVVKNNVIYACSPFNSTRGQVQAVSSAGVLLWNYTLGGATSSSPTVADGLVYAGSSYCTDYPDYLPDDQIYALDATTGTLIWNYTCNGAVSTATVSGSTVFVGTSPGYPYYDRYAQLYALDASTGTLIWNFTTAFSTVTNHDSISIYGAPAVDGGVVYFGTADNGMVSSDSGGGRLYGLNATTGEVIINDMVRGWVMNSPSIYGGVAFVGTYGSGTNSIYAFNLTDGSQVWRYTLAGEIYGTPEVKDDIVYFGSYENGYLYAFNYSTGAFIWDFNAGSGIEVSPVIVNNVIYVATMGGKLFALYFNGSEIWHYDFLSHFYASLAVSSVGVIYFCLTDNKLYAVDADVITTPTGGGGGGGFSNSSPTPTPGMGGGGFKNPLQGLLDLLKQIPPWALWVIVAILIIVGLAGVAKGNKKKGGGTPSRSFSPSYGGM